MAAVRVEEGERRLALLRWGLIPRWADDPKIGNKLINARGETPQTPSFRTSCQT
ncbi:SOS response-associated peptidase family protein [Geoalkalibacter sp.]|uniref:SOS response-associated peptidase family protein n=1 Tax=Geoalkalibacter sp. TaxID=3041440 RepID=UPI003FA576B8